MSEKLHIGILAPQLFKNHLSYYYALIKSFTERNHNITLFSDKWFIDELVKDWPNINYVPKKNTESAYRFFKRIRKETSSCNLVIVEQSYGVTMSYFWGFRNSKSKVLYTVHNVSSWIAPNFPNSIKSLIINLLHILIIKRSDGVIVVSENLKRYISELGLIGNKPTFYLPFSLPRPANDKLISSNNDTIKLVIPGTIDPIRRDYTSILNSLEKIIDNGVNNIQIVLLGKAQLFIKETSDIIEKIKVIYKKNPNSIVYWKEYIPQDEFDYHLRSADFFMSNLNMFYPHGNNFEIYGITKETGMPLLMLEYKKPCIFIGDYIIPHELKKHSISCASSELIDILLKLSSGELKPNLYSKEYDNTIDKINSKIQSELNNMIHFLSDDSK